MFTFSRLEIGKRYYIAPILKERRWVSRVGGFGLKIETASNVAARSLGGCAYLGGLEIAKIPSREERLAVRRVQYSMHPSTTLYHEIIVEGFGFDGC